MGIIFNHRDPSVGTSQRLPLLPGVSKRFLVVFVGGSDISRMMLVYARSSYQWFVAFQVGVIHETLW